MPPQVQVVGVDGLVTGIGGGCAKINFVNLAGAVQTIKATGGVLYGLYVLNTTGATCFVQVFDVAGTVTLGTTVPDEQISALTLTASFLPIPSNLGVGFQNAIKVASTTAVSGSSGSANGVYVYALFA